MGNKIPKDGNQEKMQEDGPKVTVSNYVRVVNEGGDELSKQTEQPVGQKRTLKEEDLELVKDLMENQLFDPKIFEDTVSAEEVEKIWKLIKLKQTLNNQLIVNRQQVVFQNLRDCRAISQDLFEFLQARQLAQFSKKAFGQSGEQLDDTGIVEQQLNRVKQQIKSINANVIGIEKEVTKISSLLD